MTVKLIFEATAIEVSKLKAPALKLYEFNYLANKAVNLFVNKIYNTYDLNQQTTDDLRVLKSTAYLLPEKWNLSNSPLISRNTNASSYLSSLVRSIQSLHGATYLVDLPIDYLHLLNCICIYYVAKQKDCWDAGSYIEVPATRLTADSWATIVSDVYNKPSPMRPYYYIHNLNTLINTNGTVLPTSPHTSVSATGIPNGLDMTGNYQVVTNGLSITYTTSDLNYYTKYNNQWYEVNNVKLENGVIKQDGENAISTGNIVTDENKILSLNYNSQGTNITVVYYPDPDKTLGWVKKSEVEVLINLDDPSQGTTTEIIYTLLNGNPNEFGVGRSNFLRTFKIDTDGDGTPDTNISLVEKPIALRAGNTSNVRMEIRYGKDDSIFQLKEVQVDYIKSPQYIRLTLELLDMSEDTSQIMEFPDYVTQEIINELVHLVMERVNDPRLSNNMLISLSIARPTGQLQQSPLAR